MIFKRTLSPRTWASVGLLTGVFFSAYFVLRALPDAECGFLHYEKIVHPDGTVEYCATNHAGFLDLTKLDYPVRTKLQPSDTPVVGKSVQVNLELKTKGGMSIAPHELAYTHTKQMHLMAIDPSLEDYHHIHPEPIGIDGNYGFSFTPKMSGAYRFFTEVVPLVSRRQVLAVSTTEVQGQELEPVFIEPTRSYVNEGLRFELVGLPLELETGRDYRFELKVLTSEGEPAKLETVMGAKAHMVAFDAELRGFAHMHPEASLGVSSAGFVPVDVDEAFGFVFNVPNPGWYRMFAQIQINGEPVYGRFDCRVE